MQRIVREAHRAGAAAIVTTEKDGVRLEKRLPLALPVLVVPLEVSIEPVEVFTNWLLARIRR
jgi:tetraacyldisaccharide-1-P 4'-kinase